MSATQSELTLANLVEERELIRGQHEAKLAEIATREDKNATHADKELLRGLRERAEDKDTEITELTEHIERDHAAIEESKKIRRIISGPSADGVDVDGDGVVYRTMAAYARDVILTRQSTIAGKIASRLDGGDAVVQAARERLQMVKRVSNHTLSSDVDGLIPDQHIAQIFQVIDKSRMLVESARRTTLDRDRITFPRVVGTPEVDIQASEKTAAGDEKLEVEMDHADAVVLLGGGNLSWQAINWSSPDALRLWFDEAAAHYALKSEMFAADVLMDAANDNPISSPLDGTDSFAEWVGAIARGRAEVYLNSGRLADTVYVAPDQFFALSGVTTDETAPFVSAGQLALTAFGGTIAGLNVVVSRGIGAGRAAVGASQSLLVAETAGAPIELQVTEPSIGGLEVGIIGGFAAVAVDDAFALLTTAS